MNWLVYGYLLPLVICLLMAAYERWFSKDDKRDIGVVVFLGIAFIPVLNWAGPYILIAHWYEVLWYR